MLSGDIYSLEPTCTTPAPGRCFADADVASEFCQAENCPITQFNGVCIHKITMANRCSLCSIKSQRPVSFAYAQLAGQVVRSPVYRSPRTDNARLGLAVAEQNRDRRSDPRIGAPRTACCEAQLGQLLREKALDRRTAG